MRQERSRSHVVFPAPGRIGQVPKMREFYTQTELSESRSVFMGFIVCVWDAEIAVRNNWEMDVSYGKGTA